VTKAQGPAQLVVFRQLRRFLRVTPEEARRLVQQQPEVWRWPTPEETRGWTRRAATPEAA